MKFHLIKIVKAIQNFTLLKTQVQIFFSNSLVFLLKFQSKSSISFQTLAEFLTSIFLDVKHEKNPQTQPTFAFHLYL